MLNNAGLNYDTLQQKGYGLMDMVLLLMAAKFDKFFGLNPTNGFTNLYNTITNQLNSNATTPIQVNETQIINTINELTANITDNGIDTNTLNKVQEGIKLAMPDPGKYDQIIGGQTGKIGNPKPPNNVRYTVVKKVITFIILTFFILLAIIKFITPIAVIRTERKSPEDFITGKTKALGAVILTTTISTALTYMTVKDLYEGVSLTVAEKRYVNNALEMATAILTIIQAIAALDDYIQNKTTNQKLSPDKAITLIYTTTYIAENYLITNQEINNNSQTGTKLLSIPASAIPTILLPTLILTKTTKTINTNTLTNKITTPNNKMDTSSYLVKGKPFLEWTTLLLTAAYPIINMYSLFDPNAVIISNTATWTSFSVSLFGFLSTIADVWVDGKISAIDLIGTITTGISLGIALEQLQYNGLIPKT